MQKKLYEIFTEINPEILNHKNADLIAEGVIDSFDVSTLIIEIEAAFGFEFSIDELVSENFSSVSVIEQLVSRKIED